MFQSYAIEIDTEKLAVMAGTLANGGICPATGETILSKATVKEVLSQVRFKLPNREDGRPSRTLIVFTDVYLCDESVYRNVAGTFCRDYIQHCIALMRVLIYTV